MQMSQRAKRMERRNDRGKKNVALNLVSLMDIFTILVFFLLVNSGQVETLPNAKDLKLPQSVAEQKARENVVIIVTDDGPGIPAEVRDRVFEPFFTTKAAGEGSGLGLDICAKIIDRHGGRMTVESRPGRTSFAVVLPLREASDA